MCVSAYLHICDGTPPYKAWYMYVLNHGVMVYKQQKHVCMAWTIFLLKDLSTLMISCSVSADVALPILFTSKYPPTQGFVVVVVSTNCSDSGEVALLTAVISNWASTKGFVVVVVSTNCSDSGEVALLTAVISNWASTRGFTVVVVSTECSDSAEDALLTAVISTESDS